MKAYAAIGAFCAFFSFVYAQFSHGVSSPYMTYMCLIPLVGGAGALALMRLVRVPAFNRFSFNAYNSAIATFTIGCVLHGIFDIAGTASGYLAVFAGAGVALLAAASIGMLVGDRRSMRESHPIARAASQPTRSSIDGRSRKRVV